jgi:hypothetical protein
MGLHPRNRFGDAPAGAKIALDPLDGRVLGRHPGEDAYPVSVRVEEADEVPAQMAGAARDKDRAHLQYLRSEATRAGRVPELGRTQHCDHRGEVGRDRATGDIVDWPKTRKNRQATHPRSVSLASSLVPPSGSPLSATCWAGVAPHACHQRRPRDGADSHSRTLERPRRRVSETAGQRATPRYVSKAGDAALTGSASAAPRRG